MSKRSILLALLAAATFGAATPAGKFLLGDFSVWQLAGLLYLGAALGVVPLVVREGRFRWPGDMDRSTRLRLSGAVVLGGIVAPVLLLLALRSAPAVSVSMWLNLELAATALLGVACFQDHLTRTGWTVVAGSLAAAVILASAEGIAGARAGGLVALACLGWALDNQLTALIDGISPAQTTFWKGLVAGSVNLTLGVSFAAYSASWSVTAAAIAVGALAYGASLVLYITAGQGLGATRNQVIFSSSPFFGVLYAALFLGEPISVSQWSAAALLAFSLVLLAWEQHVHPHRHAAVTHHHAHRHDDGHHGHVHAGTPASLRHSHEHEHEAVTHLHSHWPDLHHRHGHDGG